ncbi:MAG: DUF3592 domain-containing protein [Clostridia bacterium]|nr:DUF3592 domain-containing protein [Clostridia bacterium]
MSKSNIWIDEEKGKPAIIFLSISLALFLVFIGFFAWHTARMRDFELNYVRTTGTVIGVDTHHSSNGVHSASRTDYYLIISYTFEGQEHTLTDRVGHRSIKRGTIGSSTEIYVNPKNPNQAEKVSSSGFVSIICACFFAFFCVTYAAGMNLLVSIKRSTFKKRFIFVWGMEILLGIVFLLLFWLGLPNSGFGEVFVRINGAIGVTVVSCLVLCVTLLDGIITYKLNSKIR